jgi:multidrug transporter EmrE-like cation transporter
MKNFVLIIFSVVLGVLGQLSLKHGVMAVAELGGSGIANSLSARSILTFLQGAAGNKFVILGFLCYVISAASWLVILTRVDLSLAYPLISIGYILVVVLSKYLFDEPVTSLRIAGTLLVCVGVFLLVRS